MTISPLTTQFNADIEYKINDKTKPLGALGDLETLATQMARIQYQAKMLDVTATTDATHTDNTSMLLTPLKVAKPTLIVFAGDHGVGAQGVSIAPSEVTGQMVANFAHGGAAINVFCKQLGWELNVVDTGILHAPDGSLGIINQRLGAGTTAFNQAQAMPLEAVERGFDFTEKLIKQQKDNGCNIIAFGEMGISNTTSAAAIMSIIMNLPPKFTVGKGTGVTDDIVAKKQEIIEQAIALHSDTISSAKNENSERFAKQVLACVGGYEIVQLTAAMLCAAKQNMLVVVDGFICTAAAILAYTIDENVKDYMVFAHTSGEQGHQKMLTWLGANPLLSLGLRLGEGTGAALALPLIQASAAFYNDMASFSQAQVTDVIS